MPPTNTDDDNGAPPKGGAAPPPPEDEEGPAGKSVRPDAEEEEDATRCCCCWCCWLGSKGLMPMPDDDDACGSDCPIATAAAAAWVAAAGDKVRKVWMRVGKGEDVAWLYSPAAAMDDVLGLLLLPRLNCA